MSVPHTADVVTVAFGSTISATPAGSSGFYGVSSVEVWNFSLKRRNSCVVKKRHNGVVRIVSILRVVN